MKEHCKILSLSILPLFLLGCDTSLQIKTVKRGSLGFSIDASPPRAYKPGETITIMGSGFTNYLKVVWQGISYPAEIISDK